MSHPEAEAVKIDLDKRRTLKIFRDYAVGAMALTAAYSLNRIGVPIMEQWGAWKNASLQNKEFLEKNRSSLARIEFGANIIPDYCLLPQECDPEIVMYDLKQRFNCSHIRLGTWWKTYEKYGLIPYSPFIEAAFNNNIGVTLSYGAKTPGWPETKFPDYIDSDIGSFGAFRGGSIDTDSELGKRTLDYSEKFLTEIDREFRIVSFEGMNPENEHNEKFGAHSLNISENLLFEQIRLLKNYTTDATVLLNTICVAPPGNRSSLGVNAERAHKLSLDNPQMKFRVGVDIYEESPIGRIGPNQYIDNLAGTDILYGEELIPNTMRSLNKSGITFEVTEGCQLGDWVVEQRNHEPGSLTHTQYLLTRMMNKLADKNIYSSKNRLMIRLWEMEPVLSKMQREPRYFAENTTLQLLSDINFMNN